MNKFNLKQLIKIQVIDYRTAWGYTYKKEIKIFGIIFRKAGVYCTFLNEGVYSKQDLADNHIYLDNKSKEVRRYPKVIFYFNGDISHTKHYRHYKTASDNAKKFIGKHMYNVNLTEIKLEV